MTSLLLQIGEVVAISSSNQRMFIFHLFSHSCTNSSVSSISLPVFAKHTTMSSGKVPLYASIIFFNIYAEVRPPEKEIRLGVGSL